MSSQHARGWLLPGSRESDADIRGSLVLLAPERLAYVVSAKVGSALVANTKVVEASVATPNIATLVCWAFGCASRDALDGNQVQAGRPPASRLILQVYGQHSSVQGVQRGVSETASLGEPQSPGQGLNESVWYANYRAPTTFQSNSRWLPAKCLPRVDLYCKGRPPVERGKRRVRRADKRMLLYRSHSRRRQGLPGRVNDWKTIKL